MSGSLVRAGVAEKLLGVLEKFLDPAQYKIVKMKRQQKALNTAEEEFELCAEILAWVDENIEMFFEAQQEAEKFRKKHDKLKKRFNKYD